MSYTTANAEAELRRFTKRRAETVLKVAREGAPDNVSGQLVLALFSRETNMRNITGGGYFEDGEFIPTHQDHGLAQISEIYWAAWLRAHKGCEENTYLGVTDSVLARPRLVPRLTDQARFTCAHLDGNIVQMRKAGSKNPKKAGVSSYNCGIYYALVGERDYDNSDHFTTNRNYAADILEREVAIRRALRRLGWG